MRTLQEDIDDAVYAKLEKGTEIDFLERQKFADIYGEITSDTGFRGWKYFPEDLQLRSIMCLMELLFSAHRRLIKEKQNEKTLEFLNFVILNIERTILKARREIGLSDDKIKEIYEDIIFG